MITPALAGREVYRRNMDEPSVTARSNSDLLTIADVVNDVSLAPAERMELIAHITVEWDFQTEGTTARARSGRIKASRIRHGLSLR